MKTYESNKNYQRRLQLVTASGGRGTRWKETPRNRIRRWWKLISRTNAWQSLVACVRLVGLAAIEVGKSRLGRGQDRRCGIVNSELSCRVTNSMIELMK